MRHKHYDCIVAWAEGKEIQVKLPGGGWLDVGCPPSWNSDQQYRVKPTPKPDVVCTFQVIDHWEPVSAPFANMEATFDGETGKLKSVRML